MKERKKNHKTKKKERKTEIFFLVNFYFSLINDLPNKVNNVN